MKFDLEAYNDDHNYEIEKLNDVNDENIEIPIGWSSICFNETINYYNDCYIKTTNIE